MILTNHRAIGALLMVLMMMSSMPVVLSAIDANPARITQFTESQFIWETFNKNMNVTTFVSPDGSRDELWHILQSAQQSIYVEIFGMNNPYLLDLIHEIHDSKPSLDMKFLIGWNSIGYTDENRYVANNLTLLGYEVKWTNSVDFDYAHQKFVIIDNKTTVVHSGNWAKTSFPETGKDANREWNIAMTNIDITTYYRSVFDYDWDRGTVYDSGTHGTGTPLTYTESTSTYPRPFATAGHFSGAMNVTPIFSPDTSLQGILYCINSARATLDIQIPYFTNVGDAGEVDQIVAAILAAKARGVTVRIITEETYDFLAISEIFHDNDIPVVWQDTRWFAANHNKGIIVDGRMVLISSINYSDNSIADNREAGVIVENEDIAQWYQDVYDYDWGIADCDVQDNVNLYWTPNIPTHSSAISLSVYGQMLYGDVITLVTVDYRIDDGAWTNGTDITANVYDSAEGDPENYLFAITAKPDGTNITVVAHITAASTEHTGVPMVIRVRDAIGSATTTTTTTTTTTATTTTADFLTQYGFLIAVAIVVVLSVIGACTKKGGRSSRRRR